MVNTSGFDPVIDGSNPSSPAMKGGDSMRIDGKRASQYTQLELWAMIHRKKDPNGEPLTDAQLLEIKKTYFIRKERELAIND